MGKSQSRYDLNRDWIASRDSIWPLRIRFSSLRFEIWFDLGLLEIRFSVWQFGTKSHGNEPGAVAVMRVSVAADHKWPTRNILELYFVRWLSPPFIAWQQTTYRTHSSNFCQRRTALQCHRSNHLCSPQQIVKGDDDEFDDFRCCCYTLIVSKQEIWSRFETIKIWDSVFFRFGIGICH